MNSRTRVFSFAVTRTGAAYLAFVLMVSLAAVRTGDNALYSLLAVALSSIVVSGIVSRNTLKQLALILQTPDRIFAGKTVITRVSLTNTKRLFPSLGVLVEEAKNAPERQPRAVIFPILRSGETRSARLEQIFPYRGRRRQALHVVTRFPFGFFQRRDSLPSQELLVYPAIGEVPEFLQTDVLAGRRESRRRGSGDNFYSIREYRDGESVRAIDWKATAKARKLMAREYAREDEIRCLLILDTYSAPEENTKELFEKAVSLAAGLAVHYINEETMMEFLTPEFHIPAGSGDRHLYRILEALAVTRQQAEVKLSGSTEREPSADLQKLISNQTFSVILTPRPEESFPAGIRRFARIIPFSTI